MSRRRQDIRRQGESGRRFQALHGSVAEGRRTPPPACARFESERAFQGVGRQNLSLPLRRRSPAGTQRPGRGRPSSRREGIPSQPGTKSKPVGTNSKPDGTNSKPDGTKSKFFGTKSKSISFREMRLFKGISPTFTDRASAAPLPGKDRLDGRGSPGLTRGRPRHRPPGRASSTAPAVCRAWPMSIAFMGTMIMRTSIFRKQMFEKVSAADDLSGLGHPRPVWLQSHALRTSSRPKDIDAVVSALH